MTISNVTRMFHRRTKHGQGFLAAASTTDASRVLVFLAVWFAQTAVLTVTAGEIEYAFTTLAGSARNPGRSDGTGTAARFDRPHGVTVDGSGNVYVADGGNSTIRKISPSGQVMTIAGLAGSMGTNDGLGSAARFNGPTDVAVDRSGNVYVADHANHTVRQVNPSGLVTTLAGRAGSIGSNDGTGSAARFFSPVGVAVDNSGTVYVTERDNEIIRRISSSGQVTTLAGRAGVAGSRDGTGSAALFYWPHGIAVDGSGNLFVIEWGNHTVRKISPTGQVTTFAGLAGSDGSNDGTGNAARFYHPIGCALDGSGNLYVADHWNHTIRKVTPNGQVTTVGGLAGIAGASDGIGISARFTSPADVAVDGSGNLYVADYGNALVRKGVPSSGLVTPAPEPAYSIVYSTGFEGDVGAEWSLRRVDTTPSDGGRFLGQFRNENAMLTLGGLPTHNFVVVFGDLYLIRTWDGNSATSGPDVFDLSIADGPNLLHSTFSLTDVGVFHNLQSFPGAYPGKGYPGGTGAAKRDVLGYYYPFADGMRPCDGVYALAYVVPHSTRTLQLTFSASGLESRHNESWGLDNIAVGVANVATSAPPRLISEPSSQILSVGDTAVFQVLALGAMPLNYQWRHEGTNLATGTTPTLCLSQITMNQRGRYLVEVSNRFGSVSSAGASLEVKPKVLAPFINAHPQNRTLTAGQRAVFSAESGGTAPLRHQWQFNGSDVLGATNKTLVLDQVRIVHAGFYSVVVKNSAGSVRSFPARLNVTGTIPFYANDFEGVISREWSKRVTDVSPKGERRFLGQFGNETVSLSLDNLPPHTGVTISLDLYILRSWDGNKGGPGPGPDLWELFVTDGPSLLYTTFKQGQDNWQSFPDNYPDGTYDENTGAALVDALGYYVGSSLQDAAYRLTYSFPHSSQSVVLNMRGSGLQGLSDESWGLDNVEVILAANSPTPFSQILTQPQSQFAGGASHVSLKVAAAGPALFTYQWFKNGVALADDGRVTGVSTDSLSIASAAETDSAVYTVTVSSPYGRASSQKATLTVLRRTRFDTASPGLLWTNGLFHLRLVDLPTTPTRVMIEASTNLASWEPVFLQVVSSNSVGFAERTTNLPWRFYRALIPP